MNEESEIFYFFVFVFLTEFTVNHEDGKIESFSNFVVKALFLKLS